ncbi:MAG: flagellar hook-basal body complex protein [Lachnospiraceae bacterium]|uniref:Flagellar hook protein FlgE n=1 Tax=Waltera intestinalis TaxID=2606635 RepID=A0A6L5YFL8_9FIRM|nr:flagellar hook-basal body complex protein [Waltera intestinalis]MDY3658119.1 flagellar hook-basal body complex protein [Lachnospiraceae bacterium]MST57071.1 flagellar hook-basal body complex protein [Waltera intestinalis]
MMRSLYSGVAGLKTHQTRMDVIGNNIANVNTTAYKSSSMTFSELMSQTTQKASGANATTGVGGTNAKQIGLGVKAGAINTAITTQGSAQSTGNPFDIMITGDNFFVVSNGSENFFTRDGSFYVDGAGNLAMTSTGYNVMGWSVDETTGNIKQDTVTALRIMSAANMTYPPEATTKANISGILDQNDKDVTSANGKTVNLNFFDARGYSYTAKFTFKQSGGDKTNEYSMELNKILDSTGKEMDISGITFGEQNLEQTLSSKLSLNTDSYKWDDATKTLQTTATPPETVAELDKIFNNGALITDQDKAEEVQKNLDAIAKAYGYEGSTDEFLKLYTTGNAGQVTVQKMLENMSKNMTGDDILPKVKNEELTMTGRKFDGAKVVFDKDSGKLQSINNSTTNLSTTLNFPATMGNFSNITIDLSECTNYDNKGTSTIGATSGDLDGLGTGRRLGDMIGVSIQKDGMIYASYDNGMTKLLGQIATAAFANASGLEKEGDNLYSATLNSGEFDGIGVDITAGGGYMSTGQLEMSNVDLSSEFTEMITTQRGFQANSRIITVSDTLLEELTNLKR